MQLAFMETHEEMKRQGYVLTVFGPEVKTGPVRSSLPVRIGLGTDLDLFDPVLPVRIGLTRTDRSGVADLRKI